MVNQCTLLAYPQRQNRNLFDLSYLKLPSDSPKSSVEAYMRTMNRLEQPFRGATTLQEQINHLFGNGLGRTGEESNLTPWAPAVDIYETENELVVKADLPHVNPQDLDIRVENNVLTIRGERKFDAKVHDDNYLRIERAYGSFNRSFSAANPENAETTQAHYPNGDLHLSPPKH